ncbi:type II toxin-antitoxin system RelB family antitoxin [Dyella sp. KRB-257]|uniref:type II toxin-antitoxin system RelB family antitoxin n=1 Tax=Dyella sp. KRB-257 TaxID=3400915 RepID=UPI003C08A542
MLAIRLPEAIELRLEALAKATGRTKTYYAREAIVEHIDDLEDLYLAEQELLKVRAGRSKTVPLADVMKKYGLAD